MKKIILVSLILSLFSFSKCKKDRPDSNGLPPATQTGANTLGFLLNGQTWTPKGWNGSTTNLSLYYDDSYHDGTFNIASYRLLGQGNEQSFAIAMDSFQTTGTFYLTKNSNLEVVFIDDLQKCTITAFDTSVYRKGKLVITKFDKLNQILSGTFDFTLYKSDCGDSIKITAGRFDLKY
ncbi:MAG TPA: DUF6252 family protein [Hanamia sp.]|nr:DUF6252 family protein [Hanamia sp.]